MSQQVSTKTALVLAGGGLTGAVYEIGALRAIDDLLVDRTVNDFDIYVGTSAGSLVSAFLANGMRPHEMMEVVAGEGANGSLMSRNHIFNLNRSEIVKSLLRLPLKAAGVGLHYLRHLDEITLLDLLWSLTGMLPEGLYDSLALERFVRRQMELLGYSNRFTDVPSNLHIIATDLDTGERVVFDARSNSHVPVSLAVAASSALPVVFKPVRIGNRAYVDGGLRGTASLDLAIEQGANLVICINSLVPYHNLRQEAAGQSLDQSQISSRGFQAIANQALRIMTQSGLYYHIKQLRRLHPHVDIILIEPRPDDFQMFSYNIMTYSARLVVARHGFESVTLDLAKDYPIYKQILARHGIPISRRLVIQELNQIAESGYDSKVIQKVLSARSAGCGESRDTPVCRLDRALAELELALDGWNSARQPEM